MVVGGVFCCCVYVWLTVGWFVLVSLQMVWFVVGDWRLDFWFCVVMLYVLVSGFGWMDFAIVDYYG